MIKSGEFDTVKGFFELYCFLKRPSEIPTDHKLMMFRNEKKPLWEVIFILKSNIKMEVHGLYNSKERKKKN